MIKKSKKKINVKGFNDTSKAERQALSTHIDELYSLYEKYGDDAFKFLEKTPTSDDSESEEESFIEKNLDEPKRESVFDAAASVVNSIPRENLEGMIMEDSKKYKNKKHDREEERIPSSPLEINPFVFESRLGLLTLKSFYTSERTVDLYEMINESLSSIDAKNTEKLMTAEPCFSTVIHTIEKLSLNYSRPCCMISVDEFKDFVEHNLRLMSNIPENLAIALYKAENESEKNELYLGVNVINLPDTSSCFEEFEDFMNIIYKNDKFLAYSILYRIMKYVMTVNSSVIIDYSDSDDIINDFYFGRAKSFNDVYKDYVYEYLVDNTTGKKFDNIDEWLYYHIETTRIIDVISTDKNSSEAFVYNFVMSRAIYENYDNEDEDEEDGDSEDYADDLDNTTTTTHNVGGTSIHDFMTNKYSGEHEMKEEDDSSESCSDDLANMLFPNEEDEEEDIDESDDEDDVEEVEETFEEEEEETDDSDEEEPSGDSLTFNMPIPADLEIKDVRDPDDVNWLNGPDLQEMEEPLDMKSNHYAANLPSEDIVITPRRRN